MTRLPAENRKVKGRSDFESPEFLQQCSHPSCSESRSLESHHIWRRSFLGGAYNHVELWDGTIVGNVVLLCREHHQEITENKAEIAFRIVVNRRFYWRLGGTDAILVPLDPQPQIHRSDSKPLDTPDEPTPYPEATKPSERLTTPPVVVHGGKTFHLHTPNEGEECPTCHRTVPVKKKREKSKNRVTYSFRVPKDKVEDGSDVLEELVVEVEKTLRPGEDPRPMYFTLCDALGLVLVNKEIIL